MSSLSPENPAQRNYWFMRQDDQDNYVPVTLSVRKAAKDAQRVGDFQETMRDKILNLFPNEDDGLDMDRVTKFLAANDMPTENFRVFDIDNLPKVLKLLDAVGITPPILDNAGLHIPETDTSIILRSRKEEEEVGTLWTERTIVHEQAHDDSGYYDVLYAGRFGFLKGINAVRARSGFTVRPYTPVLDRVKDAGKTPVHGIFIEEGYAERVSVQYAAGVLEEKGFDPEKLTENPLGGKKLPGKFIQNDIGVKSCSDTAAAYGLELLASVKPELDDMMQGARHDVDDLRCMIRIINDIKPNLYSELANVGNEEHFDEGLQIVYTAVHPYDVEPEQAGGFRHWFHKVFIGS